MNSSRALQALEQKQIQIENPAIKWFFQFFLHEFTWSRSNLIYKERHPAMDHGTFIKWGLLMEKYLQGREKNGDKYDKNVQRSVRGKLFAVLRNRFDFISKFWLKNNWRKNKRTNK